MIKIKVIIDTIDCDTDDIRGTMKDFIRCKIPFRMEKYSVSFALGYNTSLRAMLGLPTLLTVGTNISFSTDYLEFTTIDKNLLLVIQQSYSVLSIGSIFDKVVFTATPTKSTILVRLHHIVLQVIKFCHINIQFSNFL